MNKILKHVIWGGIYAVLIIPFIVANNMFFPYIVGKVFFFRILTELLFGLWLILIMKDEEFRPKWSWISGCAGIFTFILLIADINAVNPYKAFWSSYERMEGWATFIHLPAYFLVLSSMLNKEKLWLWFLRANIFAGVIMAALSIAEGLKDGTVRVSGSLGNPVYVAVYFLFIFFFTLILAYKDVLAERLTDWKALHKLVTTNVLLFLYFVASIVFLFLVYHASRGGLLGVIGGIFIGANIVAFFEKKTKVIRQLALGGVVSVITIIIIFLGVRNTLFVKKDPTLSRLSQISWSDRNDNANLLRQSLWSSALKGFKDKPILGWGQEGFSYVRIKHYDPWTPSEVEGFDRAHNASLDFLVAGGILGFLTYLSLFASTIYILWLKDNPLEVTEKAIITGLLAGYFVYTIFMFDNIISYILFFTTLAYVHSRSVEGKKPEKAQGFLSGIGSNEKYQNYIFLPMVTFLTVIAVWWINIPDIQANYALNDAIGLVQGGKVADGLDAFKLALSYKSIGYSEISEQLYLYAKPVNEMNEVGQEAKAEFIALAINEMQKQIDKVPNDVRYYRFMGVLLNNVGKFDQAFPYIKKAIELSPLRQMNRFELIRSLISLGKIDEAFLEAKYTYELNTKYLRARHIYETVIRARIEINPSFKGEGERIIKELRVKDKNEPFI